MPNAAGFFAQYFPLFLLGALFGKLMEETGSIRVLEKLGMRFQRMFSMNPNEPDVRLYGRDLA